MLFALDDSIKSSIADFRANNPRTKHALNQVNMVVNTGGTQVIKIPVFKCKFCNKQFKQKHNLRTHVEL